MAQQFLLIVISNTRIEKGLKKVFLKRINNKSEKGMLL